jgi:hypothetical protein
MNTKLDEIVARWAEIGLCEIYEKPLALCLDAQRRFNEEHKELSPQFRRLSIPLIVRIFKTSEAFKNNTFTNYCEELLSEPQVFVFKTEYAPPSDATTSDSRMQIESDYLRDLTKNLVTEIDRMFDMRNTEITFRGLHCFGTNRILMYYS